MRDVGYATSAGAINGHSDGTRLQNAGMKCKSTTANAAHFNTQYQHTSKNDNATEHLAVIQHHSNLQKLRIQMI